MQVKKGAKKTAGQSRSGADGLSDVVPTSVPRSDLAREGDGRTRGWQPRIWGEAHSVAGREEGSQLRAVLVKKAEEMDGTNTREGALPVAGAVNSDGHAVLCQDGGVQVTSYVLHRWEKARC